jgi:Fic family protein
MPPEEANRDLEDIGFDLTAEANSLAGQVHPIVTRSIGDLVRSMNCYYSNFIEGYDTHPRHIDRALRKDLSKQPKQRDLQLEAVAYIEVQRAIDEGHDERSYPLTSAYALWLHREF